MLGSSRERILESLPADSVVLDIGAWADPFERADWVIDLMPYESRGMYARRGWTDERSEPERFSAATWIERDLCDREPYPFENKSIDFAICAQTLEDLRDPVWVCSEMIRIARAGYIEVPSRLAEQSRGVQGDFAGWSHHRWLVDVGDNSIEFVPKLHALHGREEWQFTHGFWKRLTEEEQVQRLWWKDSFSCAERIYMDAQEADLYFRPFVERETAMRPSTGMLPHSIVKLLRSIRRR